jgi:hypothetical protein
MANMDDRFRFLTTSIIWVAFAVILITLFITMAAANADLTGGNLIITAAFVMFLTAVAGVSTLAIWRAPHAAAPLPDAQDRRKSKRLDPSRLARLVEQLDEDEIVELETLLLTREEDASST